MKDGALILMLLLIAGCGYFLHERSNQLAKLSSEVKKRDATLAQLQDRLKEMEARVAKDEAALADSQKKLSSETSVLQSASTKLNADLAAAQQSLATELARKKDLQDQEAALKSGRPSDAGLSGPMQNDQLRLVEIDRQLKEIDSEEKNRRSNNKVDASNYHAQMKQQELSVRDQITAERAHNKDLQQQLKLKRADKINLMRNEEAAQIQKAIDASNATIASLTASLQQLQVKEKSDSQSNAYNQQAAANEASDAKTLLIRERTQLQNDLANLKSRAGLVSHEQKDNSAQIAALRSQEHDSDVKIQAWNQTIARLKAEIAAQGSH